jgi:hypothetical protein
MFLASLLLYPCPTMKNKTIFMTAHKAVNEKIIQSKDDLRQAIQMDSFLIYLSNNYLLIIYYTSDTMPVIKDSTRRSHFKICFGIQF